MLLKNNRKTNGNLMQQFQQFRQQILSSGKDPRQILQELVSSGKITKEQLNNAIKMAKDSHLM